jgi:TM2 domain-containing membrane protein YozV
MMALAAACLAGGPHVPLTDSLLVALLQDGNGSLVVQDSVVVRGENTRLVSCALAVLLGPFGAHRLYLGTTPKVAVVYGITFGGFGALVLLDLGHMLFTKDLDPFRQNDRVFMWTTPLEVAP